MELKSTLTEYIKDNILFTPVRDYSDNYKKCKENIENYLKERTTDFKVFKPKRLPRKLKKYNKKKGIVILNTIYTLPSNIPSIKFTINVGDN